MKILTLTFNSPLQKSQPMKIKVLITQPVKPKALYHQQVQLLRCIFLLTAGLARTTVICVNLNHLGFLLNDMPLRLRLTYF